MTATNTFYALQFQGEFGDVILEKPIELQLGKTYKVGGDLRPFDLYKTARQLLRDYTMEDLEHVVLVENLDEDPQDAMDGYSPSGHIRVIRKVTQLELNHLAGRCGGLWDHMEDLGDCVEFTRETGERRIINEFGLVEYHRCSDGKGWQYTYDENQNCIASRTLDGSYWTRTEYDSNGLRVHHETSTGEVSHWTYDKDGMPTGVYGYNDDQTTNFDLSIS